MPVISSLNLLYNRDSNYNNDLVNVIDRRQ